MPLRLLLLLLLAAAAVQLMHGPLLASAASVFPPLHDPPLAFDVVSKGVEGLSLTIRLDPTAAATAAAAVAQMADLALVLESRIHLNHASREQLRLQPPTRFLDAVLNDVTSRLRLPVPASAPPYLFDFGLCPWPGANPAGSESCLLLRAEHSVQVEYVNLTTGQPAVMDLGAFATDTDSVGVQHLDVSEITEQSARLTWSMLPDAGGGGGGNSSTGNTRLAIEVFIYFQFAGDREFLPLYQKGTPPLSNIERFPSGPLLSSHVNSDPVRLPPDATEFVLRGCFNHTSVNSSGGSAGTDAAGSVTTHCIQPYTVYQVVIAVRGTPLSSSKTIMFATASSPVQAPITDAFVTESSNVVSSGVRVHFVRPLPQTGRYKAMWYSFTSEYGDFLDWTLLPPPNDDGLMRQLWYVIDYDPNKAFLGLMIQGVMPNTVLYIRLRIETDRAMGEPSQSVRALTGQDLPSTMAAPSLLVLTQAEAQAAVEAAAAVNAADSTGPAAIISGGMGGQVFHGSENRHSGLPLVEATSQPLINVSWALPARPAAIVQTIQLMVRPAQTDVESSYGIGSCAITAGVLLYQLSATTTWVLLPMPVVAGNIIRLRAQSLLTGCGALSDPASLSAASSATVSLSSSQVGLVVGLVAGILVTVMVAVFAWMRRSYQKKQADRCFEFPEPDSWHVSRNRLRVGSQIGSGAFGRVHSGTLVTTTGNSVRVAVKRCEGSETGLSVSERRAFIKETDRMKTLSLPGHPKVVALLHTCFESDPMQIVLELSDIGSLKTFCKRAREDHSRTGKLPPPVTISRILFDVADGMDYLSRIHKLVHNDLAARNCLVFGPFNEPVAKVADFGLSAVDGTPRTCKNDRLPWKWLDPSCLTSSTHRVQTDVWSFGVLVWEVWTMGAIPYGPIDGNHIIASVQAGLRLERPPLCPEHIYNHIMAPCWTATRPTFRELKETIRGLIQNELAGTLTLAADAARLGADYKFADQPDLRPVDL